MLSLREIWSNPQSVHWCVRSCDAQNRGFHFVESDFVRSETGCWAAYTGLQRQIWAVSCSFKVRTLCTTCFHHAYLHLVAWRCWVTQVNCLYKVASIAEMESGELLVLAFHFQLHSCRCNFVLGSIISWPPTLCKSPLWDGRLFSFFAHPPSAALVFTSQSCTLQFGTFAEHKVLCWLFQASTQAHWLHHNSSLILTYLYNMAKTKPAPH